MSLSEYTHLLQYKLWFNEASIQSFINAEFNGNLSETAIQQKTTVDQLTLLRDLLTVPYLYMFNKPDVTVSDIEQVPAEDIVVAATRPGLTKDLINVTAGGQEIHDSFRTQAWTTENDSGLFSNTFQKDDVPYVGIAVQVLEMIIVIIVKTSKDNSVDPGETPTIPELEPTRKDCKVDGVPLCVEEEYVPEDTCVVDFSSIH